MTAANTAANLAAQSAAALVLGGQVIANGQTLVFEAETIDVTGLSF